VGGRPDPYRRRGELGTFLELEAVAEPGSDLTAEHEKVERLRAGLGIEDANLVATSYAGPAARDDGRGAFRAPRSPHSWERTRCRESDESAQELLAPPTR
jgi:hypothetical protein